MARMDGQSCTGPVHTMNETVIDTVKAYTLEIGDILSLGVITDLEDYESVILVTIDNDLVYSFQCGDTVEILGSVYDDGEIGI